MLRQINNPVKSKGAFSMKKAVYHGIRGSDLHEYLHGLFPESPFGYEACGICNINCRS